MKIKILNIYFLLPICVSALLGCNKTKSEYSTIDIYTSNDIHGQVDGDSESMDIVSYGTFMKNKGKEKNTLLIDSGDTWQGSIYSNHNYGAMINDIMCEARFSARTIGNHDFDWGVEKLIANTSREYNGYTIPVLAANVYDYTFDTKVVGNNQQTNIGQKTVTYTLDNGIKVGIVGVIGDNQITSITSFYMKQLTFTDHVQVIKEEATKLREEGCQVVIASVHTGQDDVYGFGLSDYVDLVLCGHTHRLQSKVENGVYFAQFGAYGEYIGHLKLTYSEKQKKVVNTEMEYFNKAGVKKELNNTYDTNILSICNRYKEDCQSEASQVVANNVNGYFPKSDEAVNLMCKAVLDEVKKEGHEDVILSYCNTGRNNLPNRSWTYADLYESFPFDNKFIVAEIKGSDITREIKRYSNACIDDDFDGYYESNKTYKIACIDYLLYHTNAYRDYDYFHTFDESTTVPLSKNYREILRDWLISEGYSEGKELNASDYLNSVHQFDKTRLIEID